jgi:hypothetical protein
LINKSGNVVKFIPKTFDKETLVRDIESALQETPEQIAKNEASTKK